LLLRQTIDYPIYRPIQAWQWMTQTRSVPDQCDWVRPEVTESWQRCLEEYRLPLGNYANWDYYPVFSQVPELDSPSQKYKP